MNIRGMLRNVAWKLQAPPGFPRGDPLVRFGAGRVNGAGTGKSVEKYYIRRTQCAETAHPRTGRNGESVQKRYIRQRRERETRAEQHCHSRKRVKIAHQNKLLLRNIEFYPCRPYHLYASAFAQSVGQCFFRSSSDAYHAAVYD